MFALSTAIGFSPLQMACQLVVAKPQCRFITHYKVDIKHLITLVVAVLVVYFGWLGLEVHNTSTLLSGVAVKVEGNTERLNRIASALPDLRVRIAKEDLHRPILNAVITTKPFQNLAGNWGASIHFIDISKNIRQTAFIPVAGPEDFSYAYLVHGIVGSVAYPNVPIPFTRFQGWAEDSKTHAVMPNFVLPTSSFAIWNPTVNFAEKSVKKLRTISWIGPIQTVNYKFKIKKIHWDGYLEELNLNSLKYSPGVIGKQ